jgi:hypothetical protein
VEIAQNYDYMAVIETKIDDSVTSSALTIKGYSLQSFGKLGFGKSRQHRNSSSTQQGISRCSSSS